MPLLPAMAATLALGAAAEPEPIPWTATFEAGPGFLLLEDTELGEALSAFGYDFDLGWAFSVGVDRKQLDWLALGGSLAASTFSATRDDRGATAVESTFTRVTAQAHARASLCLVERCVPNEAFEFGLQLAAGGGVTLWSLRHELETAPHLVFEASLRWSLLIDHFGLGLGLGHAAVLDGELGPRSLGTGFTWSPRVAVQVYYRW